MTDAQFRTLGDVVDTRALSRWVVVKEYRPMSTQPSHLRKIFESFAIPKRARILPQDVRVDNYRGSKIVDLSSTLTAPCPGWSDFLFGSFYKETIYGVFDWFNDGRTGVCLCRDHLLAGPLPLCLSPDVLEPDSGARALPCDCGI